MSVPLECISSGIVSLAVEDTEKGSRAELFQLENDLDLFVRPWAEVLSTAKLMVEQE